MNQEVRNRLKWIQLYQEIGKAGIVCLRCGISRPTLQKWLRRYSKQGIVGFHSLSRRPHESSKRKVHEAHVELVIFLRKRGNWDLGGSILNYYEIKISVSL